MESTAAASGWELPGAAAESWEKLRELKELSQSAREQEARDVEDRARAEEQTTSDYAGRYPIELVQNAHDACAARMRGGRVWLHLTETALIVANEGAPFDNARVRSLTRYGDSTKVADKGSSHTIGYKGIGFSAVFEITDNPQIVSGSLGFQLHRTRSLERVRSALEVDVRSVPLRGYPLELEPAHLGPDLDIVESLRRDGAATVIRLPLDKDSDAASVAAQAGEVLAAETMLFMAGVTRLSFGGLLPERDWTRRAGKALAGGRIVHIHDGDDRTSWYLRDTSIDVSPDETMNLPSKVWADVRQLNVAIALPWRNRHPEPGRPPQPLHVYFPTRTETGRSFVVHGDFFVDSSRTHLLAGTQYERLNDRLLRSAAGLLADSVTDLVVTSGAAALAVLAPSGPSSEFGDELWEAATEALAARAVVPQADGSAPRIPADAHVIVRQPAMRAAFLRALPVGEGRAEAGVEEGQALAIAEGLGVHVLTDVEIADRLLPSDQEGSRNWLFALEAWLESLDSKGRKSVCTRLAERPVLRSEQTGEWTPPSKLVRRAGELPKLPSFASRDEAADATSRLDWLMELIGVTVLDLDAAIELVLDELEPIERSDPRNEEALNFFRKLWNKDAAGLGAASADMSRVRVPTRTKSGLGGDWLDADQVYFDDDWAPGSLAAAIYCSVADTAFLAMKPPASRSAHSDWRQFFAALGVSDVPHLSSADTFPRTVVDGWRTSLRPAHMAVCRMDHLQANLEVKSDPGCIDRLDELLSAADRTSLQALRRLLIGRNPVLGKQAKVRCNHGWHKHPVRERAAESLEQWLLRTTPWLPLRGSAEPARPDQCWTGLLPSHGALLLDAVDLPEKQAKELGVPSLGDPPVAALERELNRLASEERDDDPAVWQTADFLVERLAAKVGQREPRSEPDEVRLPARRAGERCWSTDPIVADIVGVEQLPNVDILDAKGAKQLARYLGLRLGSEVVQASVDATPAPSGRRVLSTVWRSQLVAYLHARGSNLERVARLVGRLTETPCSTLSVRLDGPEGSVKISPSLYLDSTVEQEAQRRLRRGTVFWVGASPDRHALLDGLVAHLDEPARRSDLVAFFASPDFALEHADISYADLAVAREALERYLDDEDEAEDVTPAPNSDDGGGQRDDASSHTDGSGQQRGSRSDGSATPAGSPSREPGSGADQGSGVGRSNSGQSWGESASAGRRDGAQRAHSTAPQSRMRSYVAPASDGRASTAAGSSGGVVDPEVERAGVDAVVEFERAQGRTPEVMPPLNEGFDVRSVDDDGHVRIIEIKATADEWGERGVAITRAQYAMAQQRRDEYWLYVVDQALTNPRVHPINDPVSKIHQYFFDEEWRAAAEDPGGSEPTLPSLHLSRDSEGIDSAVPVFRDASARDQAPAGWIACHVAERRDNWFAVRIEGEGVGLAYRGGIAFVEPLDGPIGDDDLVLVLLHDQVDPDTRSPVAIRTWRPERDLAGNQLALRLGSIGSVGPLTVQDPDRIEVCGVVRGMLRLSDLEDLGYC